MTGRPDRQEAAEYYYTYIDKVPDGDITGTLREQRAAMLASLREVSEKRADYRYAPDKWSLREVLGHITDTERVFAFRAFWFARGLAEPMPSFDQDVAVRGAGLGTRPWVSLVDDFDAVRGATLTLVEGFSDEAWGRHGTASGNPVTVRALAYIIAGHAEHHLRLIRERYVSA
jgi:DinB superfamily